MLRAQVTKLYPSLTSEMVGEIIPAKEEMSIMKVYTGSGETAVVYVLQKNPIFFEVFDRLYPSGMVEYYFIKQMKINEPDIIGPH